LAFNNTIVTIDAASNNHQGGQITVIALSYELGWYGLVGAKNKMSRLARQVALQQCLRRP